MIAGLLMLVAGLGLIFYVIILPFTLIRLFIVIVGIVVAVSGIYLITEWIEWKDGLTHYRPKLSFKQFIAIYDADPDRWDLDHSPIGYKYTTGEKKGIDFASYYDQFLYDRFYTKIEKHKKLIQQLDVQAVFVREAQLNLACKQAEIDNTMKEKLSKIARD